MAALIFIPLLLAVIGIQDVAAFGTTTTRSLSIPTSRMHVRKFPLSRTQMIPNGIEQDERVIKEQLCWDPLEFLGPNDRHDDPTNGGDMSGSSWLPAVLPLLFLVGAIGIVGGGTSTAWASTLSETTAMFDPNNFQPVCPASDGIYNIMKTIASTLVGKENVVEYGPLIASVLLRIRLELCVLESFLYEAVVPFIQKKGTHYYHHILSMHISLTSTIWLTCSPHTFLIIFPTPNQSCCFLFRFVVGITLTRNCGNFFGWDNLCGRDKFHLVG